MQSPETKKSNYQAKSIANKIIRLIYVFLLLSIDGDSHTKQWIFGYKLHIISSTGSLIIPLSADFTQADVQDNQRYPAVTSSLPNKVHYVAASAV
jgi:hypothetical protein